MRGKRIIKEKRARIDRERERIKRKEDTYREKWTNIYGTRRLGTTRNDYVKIKKIDILYFLV